MHISMNHEYAVIENARNFIMRFLKYALFKDTDIMVSIESSFACLLSCCSLHGYYVVCVTLLLACVSQCMYVLRAI